MHVSDADLILLADDELQELRVDAVRRHLESCAACRERYSQLGDAMADAVTAHHAAFGEQLPPIDESSMRLRSGMASARPVVGHTWSSAWAAAAAIVILAGTVLMWRAASRSSGSFAPNHSSTPGATLAMGRDAVCSGADNFQRASIAPAVALAVFRQYGIAHPEPGTYEVDYLIPPTLGGSDDPRNLWPQPYSTGTWNARVKDALEDRLHSLVCSGRLDLATAQRDLSRDWIAAYKKYFRTDRPLVNHAAFVKDRPWE